MVGTEDGAFRGVRVLALLSGLQAKSPALAFKGDLPFSRGTENKCALVLWQVLCLPSETAILHNLARKSLPRAAEM